MKKETVQIAQKHKRPSGTTTNRLKTTIQQRTEKLGRNGYIAALIEPTKIEDIEILNRPKRNNKTESQ